MPAGRPRPFVKLYDDFLGNPKLNRAAELVHVARPEWSHKFCRALVFHAWAQMATNAIRHMTDGRVSPWVIEDIEEAPIIVPALVRARLCDLDKAGDLWLHNWLKYYRAAIVLKERARAAAAKQARYRKRKRGQKPAQSQLPH